MARDRPAPGTALVTGASGGIGRELTTRLARDGFDVLLVGRRRLELERLAAQLEAAHAVAATPLVLDLADAASPDAIAAAVDELAADVDVLVNNAGFATHGAFARTELETQLELLQVNVVALTHLTRLLLPRMLERRRGRILNVASTAAFQPGPLMAVRTVEGGTWPLLLAATVAFVAWGWRRPRPLLLTCAASMLVAVALIGVWAIWQGGVPQFSEVGLL